MKKKQQRTIKVSPEARDLILRLQRQIESLKKQLALSETENEILEAKVKGRDEILSVYRNHVAAIDELNKLGGLMAAADRKQAERLLTDRGR